MVSKKDLDLIRRKLFEKCPYCFNRHEVWELDFLTEDLKKLERKVLSCHIPFAFYQFSIKLKDRTIDVFNAREHLNSSLHERKAIEKTLEHLLKLGYKVVETIEEDSEEEGELRAYEEDFDLSYVYYDDEDFYAEEEDP